MAEEGTLGQARASSEIDDGEEPSKEELQRRMEEARESITQTVTEIKETVTNQYYSVKETVSDALDWRHHFRQRPIAFSVGALSVGFLVGYGLAGKFKGNGDAREGYPSYEESDVYARTGATPPKYEDEYDEEERHSAFHGHSYAAQPITDTPSESSEYEGGSSSSTEQDASDYRQPRGGSYNYSAPRVDEEQEQQKPGLIERFKGTTAYDRLQSEVSSLGDRFIDELSSTAHNVVLPALFNKIKELFGVDLSGKQGQGQQAQKGGTTQTADTGSKATNAQAASASASASRGSSYATSENRSYGAQSSERTADRSDSESILDIDR